MEHFNTTFLSTNIKLSNECLKIYGSSRNGQIYEPDLIRKFFMKFDNEKENITFFDIGANTGSFCFLPLLNKKINAYCFEPNPIVFDVLNKNILLNNLEKNVKIFNIGLSYDNNNFDLKVPKDFTDSGLSTFGDSPNRFKYDNKSGDFDIYNINCKKLDTFFYESNLEKLDYVKIDTEGSEKNILLGAKETLERYKPGILFEFENQNTSQFGYLRDELVDILKSYGYNSFESFTVSDMYASVI